MPHIRASLALLQLPLGAAAGLRHYQQVLLHCQQAALPNNIAVPDGRHQQHIKSCAGKIWMRVSFSLLSSTKVKPIWDQQVLMCDMHIHHAAAELQTLVLKDLSA